MAKNKAETAAEQAAETVTPVEETAAVEDTAIPVGETDPAVEETADLQSEELTLGESDEAADCATAWPCYIVTAPNGLNLRVGPGKSYPIIKVLPKDTIVAAAGFPIEVPGCSWLQVTSEGCVTGWVDTAYLEANGEYGLD